MPARVEEVHHAKEEASSSRCSATRRRSSAKRTALSGHRVRRDELGEPDAPAAAAITKPGSVFTLDVDTVVIAIALAQPPDQTDHTRLATQNGAASSRTRKPARRPPRRVCGGDAVTGAATVILAMGAGKKAAAAIDEYLKNK